MKTSQIIAIVHGTDYCPFKILKLRTPESKGEYMDSLFLNIKNLRFKRLWERAKLFANRENQQREEFVTYFSHAPKHIRERFTKSDCRNEQRRIEMRNLFKNWQANQSGLVSNWKTM